jgi:hypothetical protein
MTLNPTGGHFGDGDGAIGLRFFFTGAFFVGVGVAFAVALTVAFAVGVGVGVFVAARLCAGMSARTSPKISVARLIDHSI